MVAECKNCKFYIEDYEVEITDCSAIEISQESYDKYFETDVAGCSHFEK